MKTYQAIHLIVITLCVSELQSTATNCISIAEAQKKGLIKLTIKGKGGHVGKVVQVQLQNLTHQLLDLKIEAGRVFDTKEKNVQDIMVTHTEDVFLSANQKKNVDVWGMCCQAHNASPGTSSEFTVGKMADSTLVKLANFIDEQKKENSYVAQQAVWTISDMYSLSSINGGDKEEVNLFRKFVSDITGRKVPPYDITYLQENNSSVSGHASKIEGVFNYTVPVNGKITIGIYNANGELVQLIFKDQNHKKGDCKVYYTFNTLHLQPGTYQAKMLMNGNVQREQAIEF